MFSYVTFGSNDIAKSKDFYAPLLKELGIGILMEDDRSVMFGKSFTDPLFSVIKPHNGEPATNGNGTMIALACPTTDHVDRVHKMALDAGAQNEGDAGPRSDQYYCGYFRDPDGNKLNLFCWVGEGA